MTDTEVHDGPPCLKGEIDDKDPWVQYFQLSERVCIIIQQFTMKYVIDLYHVWLWEYPAI